MPRRSTWRDEKRCTRQSCLRISACKQTSVTSLRGATQSVEVGEDASELSRLREPARSGRSSPFTSSTSNQRSRCIADVRDAFAHEDMDDTETMTLTRGDHAFGKMQGATSSPTDQPLNPWPEVCGTISRRISTSHQGDCAE